MLTLDGWEYTTVELGGRKCMKWRPEAFDEEKIRFIKNGETKRRTNGRHFAPGISFDTGLTLLKAVRAMSTIAARISCEVVWTT